MIDVESHWIKIKKPILLHFNIYTLFNANFKTLIAFDGLNSFIKCNFLDKHAMPGQLVKQDYNFKSLSLFLSFKS